MSEAQESHAATPDDDALETRPDGGSKILVIAIVIVVGLGLLIALNMR
jgi:hypothetical protein